MARFSVGIRSFNSGELSPEVLGRADINKFNSGAKKLENFIAHPEGGLFRRPGTRHVRVAHTPTQRTRVVPFVFSTEQAYTLEFSDRLMRVYAQEGIVLAPTITQIPPSAVEPTFAPFTAAEGPSQWRITDHGLSHGMPVRLSNNGGALPVDNATGLPLDPATTYFVLRPQAIDFNAGDWFPATNTLGIAAHGYSKGMGPFEFTVHEGIMAGPVRVRRNILNERYWIQDGAGFGPGGFHITTTDDPAGPVLAIFTTGGVASEHRIAPVPDTERDTFRLSSTDPLIGPETLIHLRDSGTGTHTVAPFPGIGAPDAQVFSVVTPWLSSELEDIQFVQSADVLYVVHPNHRPRKISRRGNTAWSVDVLDFIDGPYLPENVEQNNVTIGGTPARQQLTFDNTDGINRGAGFGSADIGRLMRFFVPDASRQFQWGVIGGVVSPTVIDFEPLNDPGNPGVGPTTLWSLGSFHDGDLDIAGGIVPPNQPAAVTFFEQRLVFGGEPETPQTIHMSKSGDFEAFSPTGVRPLDTVGKGTDDDANQSLTEEVLDDNAIDFQIGANEVNSIRWFAGGRSLLVGTPGGIYPVRASSASEAVTPGNVNVSQASVKGVGDVKALAIGNRIVYNSRNQRQMLSLRFAFETDDFVADDLTILADHILGRTKSPEQGITEMAYQSERNSILWCVRRDGQMLGLTYVPDQEVFAWHRHIVGGISNEVGEGVLLTKDAQVESVAVIPSPQANYDQLWMVVKRTIGGLETRHIEFLLQPWDVDDDLNFTTFITEPEPVYIDSTAIPYDGVALQVAPGTGLNDVIATTFIFGLKEDVTVVRVTAAGVRILLAPAVEYIVAGGSSLADPTTWIVGTVTVINGATNFPVGDTWEIHRGTALPVLVVPADPHTGIPTPLVGNGGEHLVGETVQVFADQAVHPDRVVDANGQITLAQVHTQVVFGLKYTSEYTSVPIEVPDRQGASMGKNARFDEILARFLLTIGGEVSGTGEDGDWDPLVFREAGDPMDTGPPPFTGIKQIAAPLGFQRDKLIYFRQAQPLPWGLLALNMLGDGGQR